MSLIGRCCHCNSLTTGLTPMALDIDRTQHNRLPQNGVMNEWYVFTASPADYTYYRLRYQPSGGGGGWTDWLHFTNTIDVTTTPNPIGSGLFLGGGVNLPSQGFLPQDHFMKPTRITGFSGSGFQPYPWGSTPVFYAADDVEWRLTLDGVVLSNDPTVSEAPLGGLNLPNFTPQPEGTTNAEYTSEGLELRVEVRWKLPSHITSSGVQLDMVAKAPGFAPRIDVDYEFEAGWQTNGNGPSISRVAEGVTGGVGWYHGNMDWSQAVRRRSRSVDLYYYNDATVYYNGSLHTGFSTAGNIGGILTGYKPTGTNAAPFGEVQFYSSQGVQEGMHPQWAYPSDGTTAFNRHLHMSNLGLLADNLTTPPPGATTSVRPVLSPNYKTITLVKGYDTTTVPFGNGTHGVNAVRRDMNAIGERREPADPYSP